MSARHKSIKFCNDAQLFHFCFIISENREFFQEVEDNKEQIRVIPLHHLHKELNDPSTHHFLLNLQIFRHVHQQVETHKEDFLLFLDHDRKVAFLFPQLLFHRFDLIRASSTCLLVQLHFRAEIFHSHLVSLQLMLDDLQSGVSDFVLHQELVELREVRVRLENVEQVERHLEGIFELFPQRAGNHSEQSLVLQHEYHILVVVT